MEKIYLSIDLDYGHTENAAKKLMNLIKKIIKTDIPIKLYAHHHLILKDLNKTTPTKVINIDYHDDIYIIHRDFPQEGTWANFVVNKKNATFEWRYPSYNACVYNFRGITSTYDFDGEPCVFEGKGWYKHKKGKWNKITRKCGVPRINDLSNIVEVSLVISSRYLQKNKTLFNLFTFIRNEIKKNRIQTQKSAMKLITELTTNYINFRQCL